MEIRDLRFTAKELNRMIEYYIGTPHVYKFCYENSVEFRWFIDTANEERRRKIKLLHTGNYFSRASEPLWHLATGGLSLAAQAIKRNKEYKELEETINSKTFKMLFLNFDKVLAQNGLAW